MPEFTVFAGQAAGVVALAAFIPYIVSILRKRTKPNRASWIIWTAVGAIIASSYWASGARHTIWVPIAYAVGPLMVLFLSVSYGKGGWTWFDRYCLFGAGISLAIWWAFCSPLVALLMNIFIDFMGVLPTAKKVFHEPETEDKTAWTVSVLSSVINLFAVENWVFAVAVYPLYVLFGNGFVAALIFVRERQKKQK